MLVADAELGGGPRAAEVGGEATQPSHAGLGVVAAELEHVDRALVRGAGQHHVALIDGQVGDVGGDGASA